MQVNKANILKFTFFLGLGFLLIWLATHNLTKDDKINIGKAFEQANYFWVFVSLFLGILSHISRAMRWKILLQPLGFKPKTSNTFFAVMVGYLANYALPRLGEVSRCGVLTKYEKIPFTEGFGTVIAERVIDLICLIIIFTITLFIQFDTLYAYTYNKILAPLFTKLHGLIEHPLYVIIALGIVTALFLFIKSKSKKSDSILSKGINLIKGFGEGIKSVKDLQNPYLFIFHSVFIWTMYTASLYVSFKCFNETQHLGAEASFAVLIFSTLGVIFVPGGTGAMQALVTETLTSIFGISFTIAFAFSWILWASQFVLILVLGVLSLVLLQVLNKSVK